MQFFANKNEPFGMPRGTVTAVIIFIFAFSVAFPLVRFSFWAQEIPQTVKEVVIFLAGSLTPLILKYMDSRAKDDEIQELRRRLSAHEGTMGPQAPSQPA